MKKTFEVYATSALVATTLVLGQSAKSQLVATGNLYQDSLPPATYEGNFNNVSGGSEGNQIILAGSSPADLITSFSFQFDYGASSPGATADVEFFANNGPLIDGYASPGTLLYNSGSFSIGGYTGGSTENFDAATLGSGTGSGVVSGQGVIVPQDFTFLITFSGTSDAGLALYQPPTVGANALPNGDAWVNPGTGLEVANLSGNPLEFGAVFNGVAVPDSSSLLVSAGSVLAGFGLVKRILRRA